MTQKPAGIPEDAVWSPDDQEWVIEPLDDEGRKHGECLYWRSNGSLVNRCQYEAGEPHGQYYRYHDHGEISRQGTFRHGQLHGVDVFFRTDSPTQENFPDGLSEIVWRAELDMSNGRAVGGRCFDREGRQVTERGEPVPDRPASVPDGAIYFARQEQWRSGQTDQSFRFDGTWNIYSSEGDLIAQQGFSSGTKVWENVFDEPLEGKIVSAIDAGRTLEAINAATELSNSESEQSRCIGTKYLISLSPKKGLQVARSIFENPPKTNTWWIFTRAASKALDAFAEVMNSLAWRQFEEMELEEALATIELAIKLHPNPPNTVLVTKTRLLLASRMDDEAFTLAKRVLALLPDDEARELISDLDEERRFSEWLKALDTETMTTEGAWSILGERGERLFEFARYAETQEQPDPVEMGYYDSSWPIDEALEERLSDELSILTSSRQTQDDHVTCFSFLYPLLDSTVIGGIRVRDGIWIARFQSIFLPLSLVYQVGETGFFATWNPSTHGSSQVYLTHADSRGFDRVYASVAGFLADHLTEVFDELELSAQLTEKWEKATELTLEEEIELPSHLDIDQLEPRTLWLIYHLLDLRAGDFLGEAPTLDVYEREREYIPQYPHLQAYWLLHHMVFDNLELLPEVMEWSDPKYPAVDELLKGAQSILEGADEVELHFWDESECFELRDLFINEGYEAVMSPEANQRHASALAEREAAGAQYDQEWEKLQASEDPFAEFIVQQWSILSSVAGNLEKADGEIIDSFFSGDECKTMHLWLQVGHIAGVTLFIQDWCSGLPFGEAVLPFFRAAARRGVGRDEESQIVIPGTLLGLGLSLRDFDAFITELQSMGYELDELGSRQRAEIAFVADSLGGEEALNYLRRESRRYLNQFSSWEVDTMYFALEALLKRQDPIGDQLITELFHETQFSGANWTICMKFVRMILASPRPEMESAMWGALSRQLGRNDDGDRSLVSTAFAKCADDEALNTLEEMSKKFEGEERYEDAIVILTGLLAVNPEKHFGRAQALTRQVLSERLSSSDFGIIAGLLLTLKDTPYLAQIETEARQALELIDESGDDMLKVMLRSALNVE